MNRLSDFSEMPHLGIRLQLRYYTCNLDCPYCIASWRKRKSPFDADTFQRILQRIRELPYRVRLRIGVGGEIFTSQKLLASLKDLLNEANNIVGVSFSSNIHADYKRVIEPFISSVNTEKLSIGCTLHDMVIPDVEPFFEKVRQLKEKGVLLYVGYVALPDRLEQMQRYRERCEELGVHFILNALIGKPVAAGALRKKAKPWRFNINWGRFGLAYPSYPRDYTFSEREVLKNLWFTPHSYQMQVISSRTRGMHCSAGKNYIHIDHDGNVFPCLGVKNRPVHFLFPLLRKRYSMGNILTGGPDFRPSDMICPQTHCWCGNENQALRIVDRYYHRTRALRIFYPKSDIAEEVLYNSYNPSKYRFWRFLVR